MKKIISGVRKCEAKIKRMVKSYNEWSAFSIDNQSSLLDFTNAISETMWQQQIQNEQLLHQAIDAYNMTCRAQEEIALSKRDMQNAIQFYQRQVYLINQIRLDCSSHFLPFITTHQMKIEQHLPDLSNQWISAIPHKVRLPLSQTLKISASTVSSPMEWSDEEAFLNSEVDSDDDDATPVDSSTDDDLR